ncbi:MAG: anthranilate phosphoribosyltransferase [Cytophagales bacterium]|nr:MAG: anthranilate phosphoribosyltransferase [Cytophagales bacterium]
MKDTLQVLFEYRTLNKEEAKQALKLLTQGEVNSSQMAAFMTVYLMRSITVEELEGFKEAMLELCLPIDLSEFNPMDLCGTGGDGKDTFNISTLSSFIVAGAGIRVAKHGNYGVSSSVGSSNILEYFGVKFTNDINTIRRQIEQNNITLLHAPLFHPAMKNVAPIRKELRVKTFFNMLGPLVNPAQPKNQMVGVFNLELARLYSYLFQKTNVNYSIIHSLGGYDEISLTSDFRYLSSTKDAIMSPAQLGFSRLNPEEIVSGETIEDSAKIFKNVLHNEATSAQKNVVLANAAMAIHTASKNNWEDSLAMAKESLESKKALQIFNKTIANN